MRRSDAFFLAAMVGLLLVGDLRAGGIPPEGRIIEGGQAIRVMARTGKVIPGRSLTRGAEPFPSIQVLRSRPNRNSPPTLMRLEALRYGRFLHYQAKIKRQSLGDGLLTELGYRTGRRKLEKEKAKRQRGEKSRSLGRSLLRGLFR